MKEITIDNDHHIVIKFPFSHGMVSRVKMLPDRRYCTEKGWYLPMTQRHAACAVKFGKEYGFFIDPSVVKLAKGNGRVIVDIPGMYPYQKEGVAFIRSAGGRAILADDPGLGKTLQAISYIKSEGLTRNLIVCPSNVVYKWRMEIMKWLNDATVGIVTDSKSALPSPVQFTIISYTLMAKRIDELAKKRWDIVVFDECHYISNVKAQRTQAAMRLKSDKILHMSGTPFLNRPIELFSLLNILYPQIWTNYWSYAKRYCNAHKSSFGWDFSGSSNLEELRNRLSVLMLRRTKQDVLKDLPSLTRDVVPVAIDYAEYKRVRNEVRDKNPLTALGILRHVVEKLKIDSAVELAENILRSGEKVIIYCHYLETLEEIKQRLSVDYSVGVIQGDTPSKERGELVNAFQLTDTLSVMLITDAGGEGIDLYKANHIIFVGRAWNAGKEEQIEGRCHRLGQQNPVTAHYLVAAGTIDEYVHDLIEEKRRVVSNVLPEMEITKDLLNLYLKER